MPRRRTQDAFRDELPRLLADRGISQRTLARGLDVNQSYLSFVLQGRRPPSRRLLEGAAKALELPADYFREAREAIVIERVKRDPVLLDRVYALITRAGG
jgi:transcriptional regulator with XRE-family HTH domain